mmetsp:Transcript_22284/g.48403  ORF Transcript_22284/g.48403 Transcript_22284/m.48403 type:complete len:106 (+) Transcript_22284:1265-1582(+)
MALHLHHQDDDDDNGISADKQRVGVVRRSRSVSKLCSFVEVIKTAMFKKNVDQMKCEPRTTFCATAYPVKVPIPQQQECPLQCSRQLGSFPTPKRSNEALSLLDR